MARLVVPVTASEPVVVALEVVALVAVKLNTDSAFANKLPNTLSQVTDDDATVVVASVLVPEKATEPVAVKFPVARLVLVEFVVVPFVALKLKTESALANKLPRTLSQVTDDDATVVVASVEVPVNDTEPVAVKFAVEIFVLVEFVSVAFAVLIPLILIDVAYNVPRTFNEVMDEDATVVVAKVDVPVTAKTPVVVA